MTASSAAARAFLISLLAGTAAPALAQEAETGDAPPPVAPDPVTVEGARTYTPADFTRFAPKNALDMLRQVPGFAIREASQERGLGQATGNVLINGQRISGKSNDVLTELGRVPSQNVTRIDIVDGATLSIPGLFGQVANVLVKSTQKISGQYTWQPEFRAYNTDPVLARGQVSASGKRGPVDFTLGLQLQGGNSGADGRTFIYGPDFQFVERRYDQFTGEFIAPRASGRFTYDGPGSSVANLNLSYQRNYFDYLETGLRQGPGLVDRDRLVTIRERGFEYEIGGDFEFAFGPGRLKLIGLNRFENAPFAQTVRTAFADDSVDVGNRFARIGDSKERIARAEYRWKTGKSDWQISTEAAFNSLDNVSQLFELRPNGDFAEIPLPGGSAEVTEDRYEVIGSFGRPLGADLSIQLSAGGEYSKLQQVGGGGLTRSFWRPKGSFSAAWKPTKSLDVNLKLARKVGQLNFFDFLATVNLGSDTENAGNPDLVPQQSWEAEVEAIRNFGAYGTSTVRVYGRLIDDIVDIIPIGLTGESPGNIDRATVYGAEWKTTFNFDPMGWKGAKLDARFQAQRTELEDPLTGEKRRISNSMIHLAELALRHDIPGSDFAYGGSMSYQFNALNYRLTEVGRQWEGPVFANVFVEHKDVLGLNVRATIANVLGATSMFDRTVFAGRRTGPVSFFERRDRRIGPIFSFTVRGKF
jgi:outer membrane receptor for ferrienterochelin and colicins